MPVNLLCMTVKGDYEGRGNEEVLQLGIDACKATSEAQQAHGDEKTRLLNLALGLRERELAAWTSLRTAQMPDGDKLGASMAAMGIGNVHLMQNKFELAREWYARAEALCPADEHEQKNTIQANKMQLELFNATRFLHRTVLLQGLVNKPQYNDRRGKVSEVYEPRRYIVVLHATESDGIGVPVHMLVHEDNLVLV
jgi:hypothetical protein